MRRYRGRNASHAREARRMREAEENERLAARLALTMYLMGFDRVEVTGDAAQRAWGLPVLRDITIGNDRTIIRGIDGEWYAQEATPVGSWRFTLLIPVDDAAHVREFERATARHDRDVMNWHPFGARDWRVSEVVDRGPREVYRYVVKGENLNWPVGHRERPFEWRIPEKSLSDERYDLARARWIVDHRAA